MIIHWALPTLRDMLPGEVFANLPLAHAHPFYPYRDGQAEAIPFFNGVTGEEAFTMKTQFRRMSRTRLRKVCAAGLDIRWGVRVVGLAVDEENDKAGPVRLVVEGTGSGGEKVETEAEFDLVIGADGSSSRIRQWLVGKEAGTAIPSQWVIGSGIVRYTAEQTRQIVEPSEICAVSVGPGGLLLYASEFRPVLEMVARRRESGC